MLSDHLREVRRPSSRRIPRDFRERFLLEDSLLTSMKVICVKLGRLGVLDNFAEYKQC